mmetsp:Transcript_7336/g.10742  ORF Transcript_7336/g.10742 Transcript_7336/m.10742 type:complete len:81 (+) Transcript_7336:656-898(+)
MQYQKCDSGKWRMQKKKGVLLVFLPIVRSTKDEAVGDEKKEEERKKDAVTNDQFYSQGEVAKRYQQEKKQQSYGDSGFDA